MTTTVPTPGTRYQTEVVTREQIERSLDVVLTRLTGGPRVMEPSDKGGEPT